MKMNWHMALFARDVLVLVAPLGNTKKVKYYLMCFTKRKMKLLEDYDDNFFIYERGSIILKGYFFKKPIKLRVMFTFNTINPMT